LAYLLKVSSDEARPRVEQVAKGLTIPSERVLRRSREKHDDLDRSFLTEVLPMPLRIDGWWAAVRFEQCGLPEQPAFRYRRDGLERELHRELHDARIARAVTVPNKLLLLLVC